MPVERCPQCGVSLGSLTQEVLPGTGVKKLCVQCNTSNRIRWILSALPTEHEDNWNDLSDWEQNFLISVRGQFKDKGRLSSKQYESLERIYEIRTE